LGQEIDDLEDTFRGLAEAGLFAAERAPNPIPSVRVQPRPRLTLLELAFVRTLGRSWRWAPAESRPPAASGTSASPQPVTSSEQITESIRKARELIDKEHLPEAAAELGRGGIVLHREIYSRSALWRVVNIYQIQIFLYYLLCLIALAVLSLSPAREFVPSLWGVPSFVLGLGVLGAVLRGLYWLQVQVSSGIYRAPFLLAHLAAPLIGLLLAVVSFLLAKGGLLALGASSAQATDVTVGHDSLIRIAAFLAGFNWKWMLERLNSIYASGSAGSSTN
jgi:hypothetical protein